MIGFDLLFGRLVISFIFSLVQTHPLIGSSLNPKSIMRALGIPFGGLTDTTPFRLVHSKYSSQCTNHLNIMYLYLSFQGRASSSATMARAAYSLKPTMGLARSASLIFQKVLFSTKSKSFLHVIMVRSTSC